MFRSFPWGAGALLRGGGRDKIRQGRKSGHDHENAPRAMAVLHPVKVVIENLAADEVLIEFG